MVVLTAMLTAADGKGDEVEKLFQDLVPKVLKDPGTVNYAIHRNASDPNKFFVYECYENREALTYHGQTEHFKAFGQATRGLFAGRPEITFYNKVA
ncbi:MAG: antibiotic biosynthesis monooxygenase [Deltaproteobacteria bacterium]|nr:antibiotic biosynthesis monooxygenase [Deltaproteobacteria bacterium]